MSKSNILNFSLKQLAKTALAPIASPIPVPLRQPASPPLVCVLSRMDRIHKQVALLRRIASDEISDTELDRMLQIRPGPDRDPGTRPRSRVS
jgi:hypothetical protein